MAHLGGVNPIGAASVTSLPAQPTIPDAVLGLLESAPDGIVVADERGVIAMVNARTETMFGYNRAELLGHRIELLVPETRHRSVADRSPRYSTGLRVGETTASELRGRRKDGSEFSVEMSLSPVVTEDGVLVANAIRDVSDRRVRENVAAELAAVVEDSADAIYSMTLDGTLVSWNRAAERLYGYTEDEAIGQSLMLIVPEGQGAELEMLLRGIRAGECLEQLECVRRCKDGSLVSVSLTSSPVYGPDGEIIGSSRIARGITAERHAERELARAREVIDHFFNLSPDVMAILAPDGRFVRVNPALPRALGLSADAVVGHTFTEFIHPEDHRASTERYAARVRGETVPAATENRFRHADGSYRWLRWRSTPTHDGLVYTTARDVTDDRLIEEDLRSSRAKALEASRLKSEFLANMSHEIRTPLNGVLGMTSLLLESDLGVEQQEFAQTVRTSGEALLVLLNDILDFSKIEAGQLDLELIDFDVDSLVEDVAGLLSVSAHAKGLELACSLPLETPVTVCGDPGRLRQIVTNLVGNAIKFTAAGEVLLTVGIEDHTDERRMLRFQVTDTGIGIPESAVADLFESFSQLDASTTRRFGGTGLGLAISRQLVELMGGEIGVHSEVGRGSTFWFTIPMQHCPPAPAGGAKDNLAGLRVLVVDDNATNRSILTRFLHAWQVRSESADGASEALRTLAASVAARDPFDAVLLDLNMPDVDGVDLAGTIAADPALESLKMVLLTSSGLAGEALQAAEAGIAGYLTKPVRQSLLYDCLVKVLNKPKSVITTAAASLPDPRPASRGSAGHVLLAEDNKVNQRVAVAMLRKLQYDVEIVSNGAMAVEAVALNAYDAILMDCQMPILDGYAATQEIRRRQGTALRTPIIAVTAGAMTSDRKQCMDAGMDDYITKPLNLGSLGAALARWTPLRKAAGATARPIAESSARMPHLVHDDRVHDDRVHDDRVHDDRPALDAEVVAGLVRLGQEIGEDLMGTLSAQFSADADTLMAAMRDALAAEDHPALTRSAHQLKGASANLGAGVLADLCAGLEVDNEPGSTIGYPARLAAAEGELARVLTALAALTPR